MSESNDLLDQQAELAVKSVGIPPCPAILTQLLGEMRRDEPDFARVGKLIGGDVGLAAAMLKTVNSPFYGLRSPASSVNQALTLLGLRTVAQLVTGLLLRQAFPVGAHAMMERFWESSTATAETAARIARALEVANAESAYTFGLFRDCGMAVMLQTFGDYADLFGARDPAGARSLVDIENERYRTTHAHVGAHLAKSWLLPEPLRMAILHHHSSDALHGRHSALAPEYMRIIAVATLAEGAWRTAAGEALPRELQTEMQLASVQLGTDDAALAGLVELVELK